MSWITFTILAVFTFAVINILDKFVYTKLATNMVVPLMISGIVGLAASVLIFLVKGHLPSSIPIVIVALASGITLAIGIFFYNLSVKSEEISRATALFSLDPLVVLLFATIFLGEHFSKSAYLGIFLLVIGAVTISIKNSFVPSFEKSLFYIMGSIIFFAAFGIITKYVLNYADFWSVFAYSRIGMFLTLIPVYFLKVQHIRANIRDFGKRSVLLMAASSSLTVIGYLFLTIALSYGYASLVYALSSFQPFFVLVFSLVLSIFYPKILKEDIKTSKVLLKIIGVIFIVAGSILIS